MWALQIAGPGAADLDPPLDSNRSGEIVFDLVIVILLGVEVFKKDYLWLKMSQQRPINVFRYQHLMSQPKLKGERLAALKERVSGSRFSRYLLAPDLLSARHFLQICFAQRENIRRQKDEGKPITKAGEFINLSLSEEARVFATEITSRLEEAARTLGCGFCEFRSDIIPNLAGNSYTPVEISMALGLVKEGKIAPVAISHEFVLMPGGDGLGYAARYDENTDFTALFRDKITPASFM
ncbi:MAG: hypothetical protein AMK69_24945 [Nitrospira bacterium SG8_3]|nr:MAG: hypothetical protein AMK69_24945 [Nitrospira bacterium SG8_3]